MEFHVRSWRFYSLCTFFIILAFSPLVLTQVPATEVTRKCYNFTWPGTNETIDCEDKMVDMNSQAQPCINPIVHTYPAYFPPDLEELDKYCTSHHCAPYTCEEKGKQCIKWSWYDINGLITNYSAFCGRMSDQTNLDNVKSITDDCFSMNVGSATKITCVCDTNMCNHAAPGVTPLGYLLLLTLLLVFRNLLFFTSH